MKADLPSIEDDTIHSLGRSKTTHQGDAPGQDKVGALRVLTLALLNEIDGLRNGSHDLSSISFSEQVHRFEAELIRCALIQTGGCQRRAARLLGIKVTTMHAKIKRYKLNVSKMFDVNAM